MGAVGWGGTLAALGRPVTTRRMLAAVVVLPSAWVAAEAVRSWPGLGGAWAALGTSQWNQPVALASAALGGVWLTSFLLVAVNTAIVGVLMCRCLPGRLGCVVIAVVCAGSAGVVPVGASPGAGRTVRVALVQPGSSTTARHARRPARRSPRRCRSRVDLVVWGESSVAVDPASHPDDMRQLADLARRVGADLLVNVDAPARPVESTSRPC
ncbi:putative apolipoprotein N-acyltransferase [Mycobacterium xenopi 4042]|uniref:Putative apolipoprotein N-acyltransferase n=1 Tax=Mycobacterium xenopi 4042 TaxID=1299334 RepID=X8AXY4_MYCXE|nr:putative apolipoprotein N-acyltransferase [Mycobacterium xenopi 4042]